MSEGPEHRILLVEDDQALASLLAEYLGNHGYIVDVLHTGSGAVSTCARSCGPAGGARY
jgi:DNA-binding response OmpR family regulator